MGYRLFYLFAAALFIRLLFLNQSFWLDEAITANVVKNLSYQQIITEFSPNDFHPPFFYLVSKAWSSLFGVSEISLRMISVLASLFAGYLLYLTVKARYNSKIAYYAAFFFLFNPLILYYSQEARMYMLTAFFLSLVLAAYQFRNGKWMVAGILGTAGALATFYGSIFFLVVLGCYALYERRKDVLLWFIPTGVVTGVLLVPLLQQQLANAGIVLSQISGWSQVLGTVTLHNLILIPMKFLIGRISFEPKALYYACVTVLFAVASVLFTLPWLTEKGKLTQKSSARLMKEDGIWYALILGTLVLATVVSFVYPMLQYFRFLYLILPLAVIYALGGAKHHLLRYTFAGCCMLFSIIYIVLPQFHREDWKHILVSVPVAQPVFIIREVSDPLLYYYPDREVQDLKTIAVNPPQNERIVVIPYAQDIFGIQADTTLPAFGYKKTATTYFNGVPLELWERVD